MIQCADNQIKSFYVKIISFFIVKFFLYKFVICDTFAKKNSNEPLTFYKLKTRDMKRILSIWAVLFIVTSAAAVTKHQNGCIGVHSVKIP